MKDYSIVYLLRNYLLDFGSARSVSVFLRLSQTLLLEKDSFRFGAVGLLNTLYKYVNGFVYRVVLQPIFHTRGVKNVDRPNI